jgi:hypothetical protein
MSGIKITVLFLMTLLMVIGSAQGLRADREHGEDKGQPHPSWCSRSRNTRASPAPGSTQMKAQLTELTLAYGKRVEEGNEMAAVTYYNIDGMSLLLDWMEHVLTLQGSQAAT